MKGLSLIATLIVGCTSTLAVADINVGVTLSTTGPAASLGIPEKNTAGAVIDEIVFDVVVSTVEGLPRARRRDPDATAESVRRAVREQVGRYSQFPVYQSMFATAGYGDVSAGLSDKLIEDLVVSGSEATVRERLSALAPEVPWTPWRRGEPPPRPLVPPPARRRGCGRATAAGRRRS